jgi:predicted DNA-binding transcriptional regulator AlpA
MTTSTHEVGAGNVADMTMPKLLDLKGVASELGLALKTVRHYHHMAAKHRREGTPHAGDFPEPDMMFGRSPVWKQATINHWLRHRPGQGVGGGRPRKGERDE